MNLEDASREELIRDIRRLERRLERLEGGGAANQMRSIVGLKEKIIQLNEDDHIEYINRALAKMAGVDRNDVIGKPLSVIDRFPSRKHNITDSAGCSPARGAARRSPRRAPRPPAPRRSTARPAP